MKRILIYGDSNVWGDNFAGPRIPYSLRWVNRLRRLERGNLMIIANGVPGRVAGNFRLDKQECNGKNDFVKQYTQASPVDTVIIALGTNDLQDRFHRSVEDIIEDLLWYKEAARGVDVVYLLPPYFDTGEASGPEFTVKSNNILKELIRRKDELGDVIYVGSIELSDGIHFSEKGHSLVAKIVSQGLKDFLK